MITRYQLSCVGEYADQAERDAAYNRLKTALQTEKGLGKTLSVKMDKREYTIAENTSETL